MWAISRLNSPTLCPSSSSSSRSEPVRIMPYHELGKTFRLTILLTKPKTYARAFLQILLTPQWLHSRRSGASRYQARKLPHLMIRRLSIFIMADAGLFKCRHRSSLQDLFVGVLRHHAPEVFPGHSDPIKYYRSGWTLWFCKLTLKFCGLNT